MADELLGMPGRNMQMISRHFRPKMKYIFLDLMFSRLKKFSLTNLVELRSWGFFGGSLDFIKYSCNFQ
jgi:hypothetical protein